MGMMTRRNVKQRAVEKTATVLTKEAEKDDFSQYMNPPEESKRIQNQYNKTIINRMSTAELKELAKEQGIESAEDMTGADLKVELIKHFEL